MNSGEAIEIFEAMNGTMEAMASQLDRIDAQLIAERQVTKLIIRGLSQIAETDVTLQISEVLEEYRQSTILLADDGDDFHLIVAEELSKIIAWIGD